MKLEAIANEEDGLVFHVLPEGHRDADVLPLEQLDEDAPNEIQQDEEQLDQEHQDTQEQDVEEQNDENLAIFVESRRGGSKILQFNGHRYRKVYKCKNGHRYVCSTSRNCNAHVYLNDDNEITMTYEVHEHKAPTVFVSDTERNDTAVVITSRKGKEMLLFRQYTYRKQYDKGSRCRWVCSTLKNCRACVFTDEYNYITSAFEQHTHNPPKYYLKPDHLLGALREPLILETE